MGKILFISAVLPFPVDNGKKVVISGFLKYLSEKYAGRFEYVYIGEEISTSLVNDKLNSSISFHSYEKPSLWNQLWNLLYYVLIKRSKSLQEAFLFSYKLQKQLKQHVQNCQPDIIICDTIRIGQFFEHSSRYPAYYILYLEDLFSIRYCKMIHTLNQISDIKLNALGNFGKFIPSFLRSIVNHNFVQKMLLYVEKYLITKRENSIVHRFPKSLLINDREVDVLMKRSSVHSIYSIRPLLTVSSLHKEVSADPVFVFLGALNIAHNEVSITHFLKTQMDKIITSIPNIRLRIIGKGASEELKALSLRYKNHISIEGYVESLDQVFAESTGMIVPLLFGSGVKLKTLEAMARGVPIISTDFGVEGINLTRNIDCIVENDLNRFPEHMLQLINPVLNNFYACNSANLFRNYYSQESVYRHYDSIFCKDSLITTPTVSG